MPIYAPTGTKNRKGYTAASLLSYIENENYSFKPALIFFLIPTLPVRLCSDRKKYCFVVVQGRAQVTGEEMKYEPGFSLKTKQAQRYYNMVRTPLRCRVATLVWHYCSPPSFSKLAR